MIRTELGRALFEKNQREREERRARELKPLLKYGVEIVSEPPPYQTSNEEPPAPHTELEPDGGSE